MRAKRLDKLQLFDHWSSLHWLWFLYWRPKSFTRILSKSSQPLRTSGILFLNAMPYGFLLPVAYAICVASGLFTLQVNWKWFGLLTALARIWLLAIFIGIYSGIIAGSLTRNWIGGVASSLALAVTLETMLGVAFLATRNGLGVYPMILAGITLGVLLGVIDQILDDLFVFSIFASIVIIYVVSAVSSPLIYLTLAASIAAGYFRLFYLVIHPWFVWPTPRATWYPKHPVSWDEFCIVPFPGLYRLLVAYAECNPRGLREIQRLQTDRAYLSQDIQALHARTILLAHDASRVKHLSELAFVSGKLPQGTAGFLAQTGALREWIDEIVRQQILLNAADRAFLRIERASSVAREVANFPNCLAGFRQPLRGEFTQAAKHWQEIAQAQLAKCRRRLERQTVPQVFAAGLPIDRNEAAFVLRDHVLGQLETQVNLASGCPGIILCGRRRMGKSTLLRNLEGQLPESIGIAVLSMQHAETFTSLESLVSKIAQAIGIDLGQAPTTLPELQVYLHKCNDGLRDEERRLVLAFDEYEQIDRKIKEGVFSTDLLACIRESVQSDRRIAWLFAGSNAITELFYPDWPSYLVSARTIELPPFTLNETRLLLTDPMHYCATAKLSRARPRFTEEFWGKGGIERIQFESGGWPLFVQLIAQTVFEILNREDRNSVTPELLLRSLEESINAENPFIWLLNRENTLPGEWQYISAFRNTDEQLPPEDTNVRRSLWRRQLILENNGLWRLRVPLMARWLRQQG